MTISPCKSGNIDPVWYSLFNRVDTTMPIVVVTKLDNFEFNEELYKLDKWILADGVEYGWDFPFEKTGNHIWGSTYKHFDFGFNSDEWIKFDEFVSKHPPTLVFKRELMEDMVYPENYYPLNYPCWYSIPEIQSKAEFDARPILFNFIWGLSNEKRKIIHGDIWKRSSEFGYAVGSSIDRLDLFINKEENKNKVFACNVSWYERYDMSVITKINEQSKISISVGGAGRHCFRHSESPMASLMYMWKSGIKYSYPWVHNVNCVMSEEGEELDAIMAALNNPDVYDMYVNGVENCRNYYLPNYINNYILPIINNA